MSEKSPPRWTIEGQTFSLTCKTNEPWNMCRWVMPNGFECDRRESETYETSCVNNSRIKFKSPKWHKLLSGKSMSPEYIKNVKSLCTISIENATIEDHGPWICLATEDPFDKSADHAFSTVDVFVASPYQISMKDRASNVQSLVNESIIEEIICEARGHSQVMPNINWFVENKIIDPNIIPIYKWNVSIITCNLKIYKVH